MLLEIHGAAGLRSDALEAVVRAALSELGAAGDATIRRVTDPARFVARGVRQVPALAIDGRVVCRGGVPALAEVVELIGRARAAAPG